MLNSFNLRCLKYVIVSRFKKNIGILLLVLTLMSVTGVWWGYAHLTTLVQDRLKAVVGSDVIVGNVAARWNRIELDQIRIPRHGDGPFANRFSFERIVIRPSLFSLFSGRLDIKEILLEKPYLLLEIKKAGSFAKIMPPRPVEPAGSATAAMPLRINAISISDGTIDLLDWQIASKDRIGVSNPLQRYHLVTLQKIYFSAGAVTYPFSELAIPLQLELTGKGGGRLQISGDIAPKGLDSVLKIDLSGLNIIPYRPYFIKKGDLNVSSGLLSGTCSLSIKKRTLNAPGILHLKNLAIDHSGAKGVLLGVPASGFTSLMSDNNNELSVPFMVEGNLDNPHFSARQSLLNQVATAISAKIGIPTVTGVGKGIYRIGEKGVKGLFGITDKKK